MDKIYRLFDTYYYQQKNHPNLKAFNFKIENKWHNLSIDEFINRGNALSAGLMKAGIKKGSKIGLVSGGRYEWHLVDMAVCQLGAVLVPLYTNITIADYEHIFKETDLFLIFVSIENIYKNVQTALDNVKIDCKIFSFDNIKNVTNYKSLMLENVDAESLQAIDEIKKTIDEEDLTTIIYTSGTEGKQKGIMLSHKNIVSNILATQKIFFLNNNDVGLSFLPLNHIYEKTVSYIFIYAGVTIYYAESLLKVVDNAKEVKPTIFACIPLLIKKIYDKIIEKSGELKGLKGLIFNRALKVAHAWDNEKKFRPFYNLERAILDKLVFSKWRAALGGRIKIIASGSAALNPAFIKVFQCAKIFLLEGYGLTETSPIVSVNRPDYDNIKLGTTGPLLDGVQVKIADDGEILVKGDLIMKGYFKDERKTKEVIKNGWFATGDIGAMIDNKFLKITDRKKEIFKTSGGKYVSPQLVESKIKESALIEHCIAIGANKSVVATVVQPNWDLLTKWCQKQGLHFEDKNQMIKQKEVITLYRDLINNANAQLASYEQVRRMELIADTWSISTGELTPTLKIKRKTLNKKYKSLYEKIYKDF